MNNRIGQTRQASRRTSPAVNAASLLRIRGLAILSQSKRAALAERISGHFFERGEMIFGEAAPPETVYVLFSGIAKLTCLNPRAERILVELIGNGEVFGVTAILPAPHRQIACEAVLPCTVGTIGAGDLVRIVTGQEYADFSICLRLMMERWWSVLTRYASFLDHTLEERIALALLELAAKIGIPDDRGTILNLRLTHSDIAGMVGGSRPKVTAYLTHLSRRGMIIRDGRRIVVVRQKLNTLLNLNAA